MGVTFNKAGGSTYYQDCIQTKQKWSWVKGFKEVASHIKNVAIVPASVATALGFITSQAIAAPIIDSYNANEVSITQGANVNSGVDTNIVQYNDYTITSWQSLDTSVNDVININQLLGSGATIVLEDVSGTMTQYLGSLYANGNVFMVNRAGITFGANSHINVDNFLATTADDIIYHGNGEYSFDGFGDASIINHGDITVSQGGFVVLAAPYVENTGFIKADLGQIELASTTSFTLDLRGDNLITYAVRKEDLNNLGVTNTGTIQAHSGVINISTKVASDIVESVVNLEGVIDADFFDDTYNNAGTIEVIANGDINLKDVQISANAGENGDGGIIITKADGLNKISNDTLLSATGGTKSGDGGFIELSGSNINLSRLNPNNINLKAPNGKNGTLLIDPDILRIKNGAAGTDETWNSSHGSNASAAPSSGTGYVYEQTLEAITQGGTNVILAAKDAIILEDLVDDGELGLGSADGEGGIKLLTTNGGGNITFVDKTNKITTTGGNITLTAGNSSGTIDVGGLKIISNQTGSNIDSSSSAHINLTAGGDITVTGNLLSSITVNSNTSSHSINRDTAIDIQSTNGDIVITGDIKTSSTINYDTSDQSSLGVVDKNYINLEATNGKITVDGDISKIADINITASGSASDVDYTVQAIGNSNNNTAINISAGDGIYINNAGAGKGNVSLAVNIDLINNLSGSSTGSVYVNLAAYAQDKDNDNNSNNTINIIATGGDDIDIAGDVSNIINIDITDNNSFSSSRGSNFNVGLDISARSRNNDINITGASGTDIDIDGDVSLTNDLSVTNNRDYSFGGYANLSASLDVGVGSNSSALISANSKYNDINISANNANIDVANISLTTNLDAINNGDFSVNASSSSAVSVYLTADIDIIAEAKENNINIAVDDSGDINIVGDITTTSTLLAKNNGDFQASANATDGSASGNANLEVNIDIQATLLDNHIQITNDDDITITGNISKTFDVDAINTGNIKAVGSASSGITFNASANLDIDANATNNIINIVSDEDDIIITGNVDITANIDALHSGLAAQESNYSGSSSGMGSGSVQLDAISNSNKITIEATAQDVTIDGDISMSLDVSASNNSNAPSSSYLSSGLSASINDNSINLNASNGVLDLTITSASRITASAMTSTADSSSGSATADLALLAQDNYSDSFPDPESPSSDVNISINLNGVIGTAQADPVPVPDPDPTPDPTPDSEINSDDDEITKKNDDDVSVVNGKDHSGDQGDIEDDFNNDFDDDLDTNNDNDIADDSNDDSNDNDVGNDDSDDNSKENDNSFTQEVGSVTTTLSNLSNLKTSIANEDAGACKVMKCSK